MGNAVLPKQIDPIQLSENRSILQGEISFLEMTRLSELLVEKSGFALVDLEFGQDELGYAFSRGSIKAKINVICQRCNNPMWLSLDVGVSLSPVRTEKQAEELPTYYDPLQITGELMSLATIVEEEILLSIPNIPRHLAKDCPVKASQLIEWEEEEKDKINPFQDLKKLLRE